MFGSGACFASKSDLSSVFDDSSSRLPKISSSDDATDDDMELKNGISRPGGEIHGVHGSY